jgi:hypothetical protein
MPDVSAAGNYLEIVGKAAVGRSLRPVALALAIAGCTRAPTINLFGSYFPAWMLCAAGGIGATVVIWKILALAGISEYVVAPFLTYAGLALSATLIAWLLWF